MGRKVLKAPYCGICGGNTLGKAKNQPRDCPCTLNMGVGGLGITAAAWQATSSLL